MFRKRGSSRAEAAASDSSADVRGHAHTEEIARSLPNATAMFLPGNHFVAAGNPEAFNAAVLDFLKDVQEARQFSR